MARYLPLPDSRHIRLLQLQSAPSVSDVIRGTLSVVSLDDLSNTLGTIRDTCRYDAVSYVWGETNGCYEIMLNGWSCSVHKNLWSFLEQHQHHNSSPHLWIDAVCIDQKDVAEQSNQVQLMSEIYRVAQNVLVWLGPATDDSDIAMDAIEGRSFKHQLGHNGTRFEQALLEWSSREYWFRTWTIQEFLLGKNLKIICGSKQISYTAAERFCESLHAAEVERTGQLSALLTSQAYGLLNQRSRPLTHKAPLLDLIIRNRKSLCSKPHDKVFAMLGLASDCTSTRTIQVDYSRAIQYLFGDVLTFCNIPRKDIFRYGHFLKHVLRIEAQEERQRRLPSFLSDVQNGSERPFSGSSEGILRLSGMLASRNVAVLNANGFKTGKIVRLGQLTQMQHYITQQANGDLFQTKTEISQRPLDLGPLTQGQYGLRTDDWSQMLKQLSTSDLRRLSAPMHLLQTIGARSFPASRTPNQSAPPTSPGFALAVAYFPGHRSKKFMAGLTFGHCNKGDAILQFPGYDVAVTLSADELPRLTGRIFCADVEGPTTDSVTFEDLKYSNIQSPAECRSPQSTVNLMIKTDELLQLVG